ncbi:MAG: hypothetical protein QXQ02_10520 [Halobacteria archaeon]
MILNLLKSLRIHSGNLAICPKCGKASIVKSSLYDGWLFPNRFACIRCGYSGYLVMELEKVEEESVVDSDV